MSASREDPPLLMMKGKRGEGGWGAFGEREKSLTFMKPGDESAPNFVGGSWFSFSVKPVFPVQRLDWLYLISSFCCAAGFAVCVQTSRPSKKQHNRKFA